MVVGIPLTAAPVSLAAAGAALALGPQPSAPSVASFDGGLSVADSLPPTQAFDPPASVFEMPQEGAPRHTFNPHSYQTYMPDSEARPAHIPRPQRAAPAAPALPKFYQPPAPRQQAALPVPLHGPPSRASRWGPACTLAAWSRV